jgi:protein phosphatase
MPRVLPIPARALVLMVGTSGSGKTTFARARFAPTEIVSSDVLRGVVRDDETNMEASADAFAVLRLIVEKRLAARRFTVVDATNVRSRDRAPLIVTARAHGAPLVAIVMDVDAASCVARNEARGDRPNSHIYVMRQHEALRASLVELAPEGFTVHLLDAAAASDASVTRL